jgi:hypothetical protein
MKERILLLIFVALFLDQCISIGATKLTSDKIISYSNIPSKQVEPFEFRKTYWYFLSWEINEQRLISDILSEQLQLRPEAKGIRNLEIVFFDEYYDSSQKLYRNPIIASFALLTSYAYNLYLTCRKSILIRGEVFY